MGEEPWRIHVTGVPVLDGLLERVAATPDTEWHAAIGGAPLRPFGVVTFHPPTIAPGAAVGDLDVILAVCARLGTVVATSPGADPGAQAIVERLHAHQVDPSGLPDRPVTRRRRTLPTVAAADVVIGNSSSGIVEVPTFGVPVVNVGDRQKGRERPAAVLDARTADRVDAAVTRALDPAFRASIAGRPNPYGDGLRGTAYRGGARRDHAGRAPGQALRDGSDLMDPSLYEVCVPTTATLRRAMEAIDDAGSEIALLVDEDDLLVAVLTDGDIRRAPLATWRSPTPHWSTPVATSS